MRVAYDVITANELWKKFGSLAASSDPQNKLKQMIDYLNQLVGPISPLHIGPRALPFGEAQTGAIEGPRAGRSSRRCPRRSRRRSC